MPRYIRQKLAYSCGPIALMNAVKWAGYSLSRREYLDHYAHLCKYEKGFYGTGTQWKHMHKAIVATPELKLITKLENPTLRSLDRFLNKKYSAIVRYRHKQGGHYIFMPKRTTRFYYVVNDDSRFTLAKISRKNFSKKLRFKCPYDEISKAWVLEAT
jgi:hypothetical protein